MVLPWHKEEFVRRLATKAQWPHALLLRGPEGVGKLAYAEALAGALLCESPDAAGIPCRSCRACGWLEQGSHPDLLRLEPGAMDAEGEAEPAERKAARQIEVEQVRAVADFINISSHRGRAKVVLIHPAEALNANAANALLKGLEEPPPDTYFLLVAHRWRQLLPTIKSRCQHVTLVAPGVAAANAWLKEQGFDDAELRLAQAGGAPLAACRFDDEYWRLREAFLRTATSPGFDALNAAEQLRECAPALALGWLQKLSFDLVLQKTMRGVRYNPDYAQPIAAVAERVETLRTLRFHREMVRRQRIATHPLNSRLFLEQLLLDYGALLCGRDLEPAA